MVQTFYIERSDKSAIEPFAAIVTRDGNYVLAGSTYGPNTSAAWATKISPTGALLWEYTSPAIDEIKYPRLPPPVYSSVVEMSDGTIVLCGTLIRPPVEPLYSPALLTTLSATGAKVREQQLIPVEGAKSGSARFLECAQLNDDLVLFGEHYTYTKDAKERKWGEPPDRAYWILRIDTSGHIVWDSRFAPSLQQYGTVRASLSVSHSAVAVSATSNLETEVLSVDSMGILRARIRMDGRFVIVRRQTEASINLWGLAATVPTPMSAKEWIRITVDEQLVVSSRLQGRYPIGFVNERGYELSDGSYIFMGAASEPRGSGTLSGIMWMEPRSSIGRIFHPPHNSRSRTSPFLDRAVINAAVALGNDRFLLARPLRRHVEANRPVAGPPADFGTGVEVDIVQVR